MCCLNGMSRVPSLPPTAHFHPSTSTNTLTNHSTNHHRPPTTTYHHLPTPTTTHHYLQPPSITHHPHTTTNSPATSQNRRPTRPTSPLPRTPPTTACFRRACDDDIPGCTGVGGGYSYGCNGGGIPLMVVKIAPPYHLQRPPGPTSYKRTRAAGRNARAGANDRRDHIQRNLQRMRDGVLLRWRDPPEDEKSGYRPPFHYATNDPLPNRITAN
jgi:hypothetical protein